MTQSLHKNTKHHMAEQTVVWDLLGISFGYLIIRDHWTFILSLKMRQVIVSDFVNF